MTPDLIGTPAILLLALIPLLALVELVARWFGPLNRREQ
jgi:hypothetical protein